MAGEGQKDVVELQVAENDELAVQEEEPEADFGGVERRGGLVELLEAVHVEEEVAPERGLENVDEGAWRLEGGVALHDERRLGQGHAVGLKLARLSGLHIGDLQLLQHLERAQLLGLRLFGEKNLPEAPAPKHLEEGERVHGDLATHLLDVRVLRGRLRRLIHLLRRRFVVHVELCDRLARRGSRKPTQYGILHVVFRLDVKALRLRAVQQDVPGRGHAG